MKTAEREVESVVCIECEQEVAALENPHREVPWERATQHAYKEFEPVDKTRCMPCGHGSGVRVTFKS